MRIRYYTSADWNGRKIPAFWREFTIGTVKIPNPDMAGADPGWLYVQERDFPDFLPVKEGNQYLRLF